MEASSFSNSHWPRMFRSKHAAEPWQTQPDVIGSSSPSLLPSGGTTATGRCLRHPLSGFAGGEERTPDPKPRWNPKPEQIRILEAIFNSGMINPPRDEIPRIRMRLQEYGQVGDANVFYWFQNRKARSKNKMRAASTAAGTGGRLGLGLGRVPPMSRGVAAAAPVTPPPQQLPLIQNQFQLLASPAQAAPTSSSSSSSDRSSGSSKPAATQAMSAAAAAMDMLGPLAAACPRQMYYHGHPVAPPASAPAAHKVLDLVAASDEPVFHALPQGSCFSAAEVAAILGAGGQYMHVPVQQQLPPPAALPAGAFLGLCNEVTEPTVTGHRTCAWGPAAGLGQFWLGGGVDHHQLGKNNTTAAATNTTVAREMAHEDATKLGLLQYGFGATTTVMEAASAAPALAASPAGAAAVTVASVAATTAGLTTGFPASTNGVIANYDLLQGLATMPGAGAVVGVSTGGAPAAVAAAAPTAAVAQQEGVVALCITDTVTGKSVVHNVAAARLDVRAHFGEAAMLLRVVGERGLDVEPVPVDASGCTVEPLQHGAFYYLLV